jgi:hypothetical protein
MMAYPKRRLRIMIKYTIDQIDDLIDYLEYCVKEGAIDEGEAIDLIRAKKWQTISNIRDRADAYADAVVKDEL